MVTYPSGTWTVAGQKVVGGSGSSVAGEGYRDVNTSASAQYPKGVWSVAGEKVLGGSGSSVAGVSSMPNRSPTAGKVIRNTRTVYGVDAPIQVLGDVALRNSPQARKVERSARQIERIRDGGSFFRGLPVSESGKVPKEELPNPFLGKLGPSPSVFGRLKSQVAYMGGPFNFAKNTLERGILQPVGQSVLDIGYLPLYGAGYVERMLTKKSSIRNVDEGLKRGGVGLALMFSPTGKAGKVLKSAQGGAVLIMGAGIAKQTWKEPSPVNVGTSLLAGASSAFVLHNAYKSSKLTSGNLFQELKYRKNLANWDFKNQIRTMPETFKFTLKKDVFFGNINVNKRLLARGLPMDKQGLPKIISREDFSQRTLFGDRTSNYASSLKNFEGGVPSPMFNGINARVSYDKGHLGYGKIDNFVQSKFFTSKRGVYLFTSTANPKPTPSGPKLFFRVEKFDFQQTLEPKGLKSGSLFGVDMKNSYRMKSFASSSIAKTSLVPKTSYPKTTSFSSTKLLTLDVPKVTNKASGFSKAVFEEMPNYFDLKTVNVPKQKVSGNYVFGLSSLSLIGQENKQSNKQKVSGRSVYQTSKVFKDVVRVQEQKVSGRRLFDTYLAPLSVSQSQRQKTTGRSILATSFTPSFDFVGVPKGSGGFRNVPIFPKKKEEVSVPLVIPSFKKLAFSDSFSGSNLGKIFKGGYAPSYTALALDIKGKMPTFGGIRSGLVLRPIVV
jgi:hypothetical protein